MASHHKSTTLRNSTIIDPHFQKGKEKSPWRVNKSQRLGPLTGSLMHIFKRQSEILHGELPQANDFD